MPTQSSHRQLPPASQLEASVKPMVTGSPATKSPTWLMVLTVAYTTGGAQAGPARSAQQRTASGVESGVQRAGQMQLSSGPAAAHSSQRAPSPQFSPLQWLPPTAVMWPPTPPPGLQGSAAHTHSLS